PRSLSRPVLPPSPTRRSSDLPLQDGARSAPRLSPSSPVPLSWLPHDPPRARQTRQSLPDPLGGGRPAGATAGDPGPHRMPVARQDRKSTRLNSSHVAISYAVF